MVSFKQPQSISFLFVAILIKQHENTAIANKRKRKIHSIKQELIKIDRECTQCISPAIHKLNPSDYPNNEFLLLDDALLKLLLRLDGLIFSEIIPNERNDDQLEILKKRKKRLAQKIQLLFKTFDENKPLLNSIYSCHKSCQLTNINGVIIRI